MQKKLKKIGMFVLGASPLELFLDPSHNGASYRAVYADKPIGRMILGTGGVTERGLMENLLHEAIEGYFHTTQRWMEPIYLAAPSPVNRYLLLDHIQFTEGMADVAEFVVRVWPVIRKVWEQWSLSKK